MSVGVRIVGFMPPGGSTSTPDSVFMRGMKAFGVFCFVVGVASLGALAIRRGNGKPLTVADYLMMFLGLAGAIGGLAAVFVKI